MVTSSRTPTLAGRLTRLGFTDVSRSVQLCSDKDLVAVVGEVTPAAPLLAALGDAADPDLALLALVRLCAASSTDGSDGARERTARLGELFQDDERSTSEEERETTARSRHRLVAVLGASSALGDELVRHPDLLDHLLPVRSAVGVDVRTVRAEMLVAVGADATAAVSVATLDRAAAVDAMRRAYRRRLLLVAATDLTSTEPLSILPAVAAALADLAAGALEAALAIARSELEDHGEGVRIAVLGMGKCGGRELNYVSDVDVIYVVEPAPGFSEEHATSVGARLATSLTRACGGPSSEPALWPVDAALRPEGKNGPLVRTMSSHVSYYERWAKTWEFQALLKARLVAGDADLAREYVDALTPLVWSAAGRENFVEDSQKMRRRVEDYVPAAEADRQIKLGKGGLRDVEFTVQLLQLVHGRSDPEIRSSNTLTALAALAERGYVGREHAAQLAVCYRFLRSLEHRVQLFKLQRTHLVPTGEDDLRRLARSLGMRTEGAEGLLARWRTTRRQVRSLHEELYYRPLLPATAQLSPEEASLAPEAARARLAAIGYRDPGGALRHIAALTEGMSRRASIQRQLLPVMLGWFAEGSDPDGGLLAFRRLSDELGGTHWYLKLLRDSGSAAFRLAYLLSTSRYVAEALGRSPESVTWLAEDARLHPMPAARLHTELDAFLTRADDPAQAVTLVRALRRRELARIACAELLGVIDGKDAAPAISDAADAALVGALRVACAAVSDERGTDPAAPPARFSVIAMGRLGGRELGYGSDADVMFVYEAAAGVSDTEAHGFSHAVALRLRSSLGGANEEPALPVDADLRPEGRSGPLVRSFESYVEYYDRWSSPWESQALLRARPVAGDESLGERFIALIDPLRYPAGGLDTSTVREIRRIKARVESERLPRGVDPTRHLKLGRGAISDVEWTVQLLQLMHAHEVPGLRTTGTLSGLAAAQEAGLLDAHDVETLAAAWQLASNLRDAVVLWSGRVGGATADVLPSDRVALAGLARAVHYQSGIGAEMEEDYLRSARRSRAVMERVFYGQDD